MSHGGAQTPARIRKDAGGARAYVNLLREPTPDETCGFPGEGPAAQARLDRLAVAHGREGAWTAPLAPEANEPRPRAADENPSMPAGYTYLLQLAGHDILQTTLGFPALGDDDQAELRNLRTMRLDLDTIYGRGPAGDPLAYAVDGPGDHLRTRFRLGLGGEGRPAGRDIGRGADWNAAETGPRQGPTDAFLADPRNDDNGLISQVSTLFMLLHGALHDPVLDAVLSTSAEDAPLQATHETAFAATRELVERAWRRILRHDLLPRLLDPRVNAAFEAGARMDGLDFAKGMPLELSHGVLRAPHVMVRRAYRLRQGARPFPIEEVLRQSSRRRLDRLPADPAWIAQWSCFFHLPGLPEPQLARRIGPSQPRRLDGTQARPPNDPGPMAQPLVRTDHVRGAHARLWSVEKLIAALHGRFPAIPGLAPDGDDREARRRRLRGWLRRHVPHPLSDDDANAIAADPPLRLFVEIEAAATQDGRRFGPLGSLLLGALFHEALGTETPEGDALARRLAAAAPDHAETLLAADRVASMPDLLRLLAPRVPHDPRAPFL